MPLDTFVKKWIESVGLEFWEIGIQTKVLAAISMYEVGKAIQLYVISRENKAAKLGHLEAK